MPVLDTSFVIDFLRGDSSAVRLFKLLAQQGAPLGVTPYTHFELYAGIGRSRRPQDEKAAVEGMLRGLAVFPFDPEAARMAGLLDAQLAAKGTAVGVIDLLIGSVAIHHGEPIVTRNKAHFEPIAGLEILTY